MKSLNSTLTEFLNLESIFINSERFENNFRFSIFETFKLISFIVNLNL